MALRRKIRGGYVVLKRGYFNDLPGRVRSCLSNLSFKGGENIFRIQNDRHKLFAIYAEDADSGEILGWVNWYRGKKIAKHYSFADYRSMYVKASERRRGIGLTLFKECVRYTENRSDQKEKLFARHDEASTDFFNYAFWATDV